jgi:hypothetical protein
MASSDSHYKALLREVPVIVLPSKVSKVPLINAKASQGGIMKMNG